MMGRRELFIPAPAPLSVRVALEHQDRAIDRRTRERRRVARQALGEAAAVLVILWMMFGIGIAVGRWTAKLSPTKSEIARAVLP
jgi:hypothetical protein